MITDLKMLRHDLKAVDRRVGELLDQNHFAVPDDLLVEVGLKVKHAVHALDVYEKEEALRETKEDIESWYAEDNAV